MEDELRFWMEQRCNELRQMAVKAGVANKDAVRLQIERDDAIKTLRQLCAEFGDNDWDDSLHLSDIINKHLGRHLE